MGWGKGYFKQVSALIGIQSCLSSVGSGCRGSETECCFDKLACFDSSLEFVKWSEEEAHAV